MQRCNEWMQTGCKDRRLTDAPTLSERGSVALASLLHPPSSIPPPTVVQQIAYTQHWPLALWSIYSGPCVGVISHRICMCISASVTAGRDSCVFTHKKIIIHSNVMGKAARRRSTGSTCAFLEFHILPTIMASNGSSPQRLTFNICSVTPPWSPAAFIANVKCCQLACQDVLFDAGATWTAEGESKQMPATFAVSSGSQVHLTGRVFDWR